jgi:predicted metalloenzyme YecM
MRPQEAVNLARQLHILLPCNKRKQADALCVALTARGLELGVDQVNGDFVVLEKHTQAVVARVS